LSGQGRLPTMSDTDTFFRSRWVDRPHGASELERDDLPTGFCAAGVACGIKSSGELDLGLVVCDRDEAVSAARFTRNALVAASVAVSRRAELSRLRAVVANSGNANVSNGEAGLAVAEEMARNAARGLDVSAARVGVASTGVIGVGLERSPVLEGIPGALEALAPRAGEFAHSIMTTDRWPKYATVELALSAGSVRLSVQAKGAGMVSPSFATMLCFIETDAVVDVHTLERLLDAAIERSFERISVDGQLSTNDSVFMISSGASGVNVAAGSDDEQVFAQALDALLKQLALEIVADGEGATRVARLVVRGATGATEPVARSVANSPLVKCALYGADPNWGRILQAAGQALPDAGPVVFDVMVEDVVVAHEGVAVSLDDRERTRLVSAMHAPELELRLSFASGGEESEIYFCDLGHEYVRINSEYS
jgi:glutamate N-acetyltransferase/amino-acid N-acetyltransferase